MVVLRGGIYWVKHYLFQTNEKQYKYYTNLTCHGLRLLAVSLGRGMWSNTDGQNEVWDTLHRDNSKNFDKPHNTFNLITQKKKVYASKSFHRFHHPASTKNMIAVI